MCCSVLQCVAGCCSVLQRVAVRCRVLQCVAVCCSVLQCVAVCCSVFSARAYGARPLCEKKAKSLKIQLTAILTISNDCSADFWKTACGALPLSLSQSFVGTRIWCVNVYVYVYIN